MKSPHTIVVGIDFSEAAIAALHEAMRLATSDGARVVAVKVVLKEVLEHQVHFHRIAAEQAIDRVHSNLIAHLASQGATQSVEAHVIVGSPFSGLSEVVERENADLLILGSRGWGHAEGDVGSVAARCARRIPVPVLMVRRRHHEPFRRILACTDFSPPARHAFEQAIRVAEREGAAVDLLHVDFPLWLQPTHVQFDLEAEPDEDYRAQYVAALQGRLEREVEKAAPPASVPVEVHLLEDVHPAKRIVDFAKEQETDLIVVGTTGRNAVSALFLGTTAERLIHQTPCSVLAVKAEESGEDEEGEE